MTWTVVPSRRPRDQGDADDEEQGANRHEENARTRIDLGMPESAEEEARWEQGQGVNEQERCEPQPPRSPMTKLSQPKGKRNLNQGQERAVGVGECPQEPALPMDRIEVKANLEPVHGLKSNSEAEE